MLLASWLVVSLAADADTPHPHQGVLAAYAGAPPEIALADADLETLREGDPVHKQVQESSGEGASGRGVSVQDVHADPSTVWSRITDFGRYPQMVDNVKTCEVEATDGSRIDVHFVIGAPLVSFEYWVRHDYQPDKGWMTWTLDYRKHSDLDDSVGFWRVQPHPDKEGWSRVFYSADVRAAGWLPKPIENAVATVGLKRATAWVKRESEKAAGHAP